MNLTKSAVKSQKSEDEKKAGIDSGAKIAGSGTRKEIMQRLQNHYGSPECSLDYNEPWQLLFATILSAQCTDARVNMITEKLYKKYPKLEDVAAASVEEFEQDIKSAGFYHMKAVHIIECANQLIREYKGELPSDIDELTSLSGVGRKTANVVRTHIFHIPSVVVDTHVKRISGRLGFTNETEPEKIEQDLMKRVPKAQWSDINLQFITLGREICKSQHPACEMCFLADICRYKKAEDKGKEKQSKKKNNA